MHALTVEELGWATKQVALIVGATEDDARPLAEFLATIDSAHELQAQVLDMLGESPLALEFGSQLIAKRFPPIEEKKPDKSQRQQRRERQMQREAEEKKRQQANRKRVKCECQGSEHQLLTNCLTCGRIVCEHEGPGPCMFCGSDVQSPDQQLQQHMRRLLHRDEQKESPVGQQNAKPKPKAAAGNSYSAKVAGGPVATPRAGNLLWDEDEAAAASAASSGQKTQQKHQQRQAEEVSEAEYLDLAFHALNIDRATATPATLAQAEAWARATRRKERLLDYDRTAAQRTRLIDQAADFDPDAATKWMSREEKQHAEAQSAARRLAEEDRASRLSSGMRVLRLDLATGSVGLERPDTQEDAAEPAAYQPPLPRQAATHKRSAAAGAFAHNPLLKDAAEPRFVLHAKKDQRKKQAPDALSLAAAHRRMLRIQTDFDPQLLY
ncbi:hypothetical protein J3B02_000069 [Coemansia erecta]|nr:hypothetical protein J3B02_000069 [Coemansia erecta]